MDTVACRNDESSNSEEVEAIKRISRQLKNACGATVARHYDMSVAQYAMTGEESPYCRDERISEVWDESAALIDANKAKMDPDHSYEEFRALLDKLDEIERARLEKERKNRDRKIAELASKMGVSKGLVRWLIVERKEDFGPKHYKENLSSMGLWGGYGEFLRMVALELQGRMDGALSEKQLGNAAADAEQKAIGSFVSIVEFARNFAKRNHGREHSFGEAAGLCALLKKSSSEDDGETWERAYREMYGVEKACWAKKKVDYSWIDEWRETEEKDGKNS